MLLAGQGTQQANLGHCMAGHPAGRPRLPSPAMQPVSPTRCSRNGGRLPPAANAAAPATRAWPRTRPSEGLSCLRGQGHQAGKQVKFYLAQSAALSQPRATCSLSARSNCRRARRTLGRIRSPKRPEAASMGRRAKRAGPLMLPSPLHRSPDSRRRRPLGACRNCRCARHAPGGVCVLHAHHVGFGHGGVIDDGPRVVFANDALGAHLHRGRRRPRLVYVLVRHVLRATHLSIRHSAWRLQHFGISFKALTLSYPTQLRPASPPAAPARAYTRSSGISCA